MNILIIAPAWVGDMVMAQSLLIMLKQNHPEVEIDLVAPSSTISLTTRMPEIRRSYELKAGHGGLQFKKRLILAKLLQNSDYDQAIVLTNSWKSALIPFIAQIKQRTGWRGECRYILINDLRILNKQKYPLMIERFCALGIDTKKQLPKQLPWPNLQIDTENQKKLMKQFHLLAPSILQTPSINSCLNKINNELHQPQPKLFQGTKARTEEPLEDFPYQGKILALCPGAEFGLSKRWSPAYFATVAEDFLKKSGQVWLLGGPKDIAIAEEIQRLCHGDCINLVGNTRLTDAIDLLALASLVVSNDSGLMHIAAAVQRPLIVIYGSTSSKFTPPLSNHVSILSKNLPCSPCFKRTCQFNHYHCLTEILPQQVIDSVAQSIARFNNL